MSQEPSYEELLARVAELEGETRYLAKLAFHDHLTSLLNRRGFEDATKHSISLMMRTLQENQRQLGHRVPMVGTDTCIVGLDLDHFKAMNDGHPDHHKAGDRVLREFAGLLRKIFSRNTDIIARTGGDEFIVVLPNTSYEHTHHLCEALREEVCENPIFTHGTIQVTTSIGLATLILSDNTYDYQRTYEDFLKRMEIALYQAKQAGRNTIRSKVPVIRRGLLVAETTRA